MRNEDVPKTRVPQVSAQGFESTRATYIPIQKADFESILTAWLKK